MSGSRVQLRTREASGRVLKPSRVFLALAQIHRHFLLPLFIDDRAMTNLFFLSSTGKNFSLWSTGEVLVKTDSCFCRRAAVEWGTRCRLPDTKSFSSFISVISQTFGDRKGSSAWCSLLAWAGTEDFFSLHLNRECRCSTGLGVELMIVWCWPLDDDDDDDDSFLVFW